MPNFYLLVDDTATGSLTCLGLYEKFILDIRLWSFFKSFDKLFLNLGRDFVAFCIWHFLLEDDLRAMLFSLQGCCEDYFLKVIILLNIFKLFEIII